MKRILGSVGAVVAGLVAGAVLVMLLTWLAVLAFFGGDFTAPPTGPYLALNLAYSFGAATAAGWLAARLAPGAPLGHAAAVATIMLLMSAGGGDGGGAPGVPGWYGTALTVLMPVAALLGGSLRARSQRLRSRSVRGVPSGPRGR